MRVHVESAPFRYAGQPHKVTVSLGVTAYPFPIGAIENPVE